MSVSVRTGAPIGCPRTVLLTEHLIEQIVERYSHGLSLLQISALPGMPGCDSLYNWAAYQPPQPQSALTTDEEQVLQLPRPVDPRPTTPRAAQHWDAGQKKAEEHVKMVQEQDALIQLFASRLAGARIQHAQAIVDQAKADADDLEAKVLALQKDQGKLSNALVNAIRLKIEHYRWMAAKYDPAKWADQVHVDETRTLDIGDRLLQALQMAHPPARGKDDSPKLISSGP